MQTAVAEQSAIRPLDDENGGVAIFAVLLVLVLLTIIGIASTNVSNTEAIIAGSQAAYQQNLYLAEGAAITAIELLEDKADPTGADIESWIDSTGGALSAADLASNSVWPDNDQDSGSINFSDDQHATKYYIDYIGAAPGSSLGIASSKVHEFSVYGRDESTRGGTAVVNIGYLMAF